MAKIMYENLNIWGLQMISQWTLALYAVGRTAGIVVNCGYGVTQLVPIYEGYTLPDAAMEIQFGRRDFIEKSMKDDKDCVDYIMDTMKLPELLVKQLKVECMKDIETIKYILIVGGNCRYKGFKEKFEELLDEE